MMRMAFLYQTSYIFLLDADGKYNSRPLVKYGAVPSNEI